MKEGIEKHKLDASLSFSLFISLFLFFFLSLILKTCRIMKTRSWAQFLKPYDIRIKLLAPLFIFL